MVKKLNDSKKGFVISILVLFASIILFAYLESTYYEPTYLENQEFDNVRISRIDQEFVFIKDSIFPESIRYSGYYATLEFLDILANNNTAKNLAKNNYSYVQDSIFELMINGTFEGNNNVVMDNKTIPEILDFYDDFIQDSLNTNFTYELIGGRIYEKTPLFLSIQFEFNQKFDVYELDLIMDELVLVDVSFPLSEFRDPQVLLYANSSSTELLKESKTALSYSGEWTWELYNETYDKGLVTIFKYPEYEYTIGNSFLRSLVNSTQVGLYSNIISFLSFEYEKDSTPYDTKNYNLSHQLSGTSLFVASLNNVSSMVDETAYPIIFDVSTPGDNCSISGVSEFGCDLNGLRDVQNLNIQGSNFTLSFWLNYTSAGTILRSSGFEMIVNPLFENFTFTGNLDSLPSFEMNDVNLVPNGWNNIIIHSKSDNTIELLINGVTQNIVEINGHFVSFNDLELGNAQFDEIVLINKSLDDIEIAELVSSRKIQFLEYGDSLYDSGLNVDSTNNYVLLDPTTINQSYSEYAFELWFRLENDGPGDLVYFLNSTTGDHARIRINSLGNLRILMQDGPESIIESFSGTPILNDSRYKHLVVQVDGTNLYAYLNSKLIGTYAYSGDLRMDYDYLRLIWGSGFNFTGTLDEFVLYNRTLTQQEITNHYYNFKSEVSGCCNYFKMYNNGTHSYPLSSNYSISTLFLSNGSSFNLSLTTIGQKNSSYPATANWYGKQVDNCHIYVYNLQDYVDMVSVKSGDTGSSCQELIERGVY